MESKNNEIVRVYDIEPNNYKSNSLPKRSRYYQSLTDTRLLGSNHDFAKLPELISIWILPYDPFGENRMIYTVKNMVEENRQLVYNDGVTKLFLYTDGKIGGSDSLRNLLKFLSSTCEQNAVDKDLEKLQQIANEVKNSREAGERYMTLQEIIDYEKIAAREEAREEGLEEGRKEGRKEGIQVLIRTCKSLGISTEETIAILTKEYSLTKEEAINKLNN